jgi:hypothetical protein
MLSPEFHRFHADWLAKADQYTGADLQSAFDRFFTLFVIYNRLYAEATFQLAREGKLNLARKTAFPDRAVLRASRIMLTPPRRFRVRLLDSLMV